jgi:AcrR family transcriptional regulator
VPPSTDKKGRYHAPRRLEQAAATRSAIIDAASSLFAENGYAATPGAASAAEARVTAKSVYTLADKPQLLLLAVDRAIVGDDEPVPFAERPERQGIVDAGSGDRLRLAAELGARSLLRLFPIYRAFEQAAAADPVVHQRWRDYQQRRRQDVQALVADIGADDSNVDALWALVTWHPVALLVEERGYGEAELVVWLERILAALLPVTPVRPGFSPHPAK